MTNCLAIDFGTSNSAAAYLSGNAVVPVELEQGQNAIPTAVFFEPDNQAVLIGGAANHAHIEGHDGRYMRSLKSVLGTSLMSEKRFIAGRRLDFYDIITEFIVKIKSRAERQAGAEFKSAVAGRPVFFHHLDTKKDAAAEADLKTCFSRAGFADVEFLYEPEAAALASAQNIAAGTMGLVVDIGGGTSDFTLFESGVQNGAIQNRIIHSNGIRLGGTNFDRQISFDHFMPLMGRGQDLKRQFADGLLTAPIHIYADLATWEKIPFLYDTKSIQFAKDLKRDAVKPHIFSRLVNMLQMQTGHDLAFLAEDVKIAYNVNRQSSTVDMALIEPGLKLELSIENFDKSLSKLEGQITKVIEETLHKGKISAKDVQTVIPVGGSSSMRIITNAIEHCLPNADLHFENAFTSIVDGLAIHAGKI